MRPSVVKSIRLLLFIVHLALANTQANDTTTVTRDKHEGPTSKKLIIIAATVAPALAFSVIFVMAMLCRRPFGNSFVLRTPALLLGASPPFEDASSLGIKLYPAATNTTGETNV